MTDKLYGNIAAGLKRVVNCAVYPEELPQEYEKPAFVINVQEQNVFPGINGRIKNRVHFEILYYPKAEVGGQMKKECWSMAQDMNLLLWAEEFKLKNRNMKITDNVLHYGFDIEYVSFLQKEEARLQELFGKAKLKED